MLSTLLIAGCVIGLIALVILIAIAILLVQVSQRDTVSTAREGWIQRRSEKDEHGW